MLTFLGIVWERRRGQVDRPVEKEASSRVERPRLSEHDNQLHRLHLGHCDRLPTQRRLLYSQRGRVLSPRPA